VNNLFQFPNKETFNFWYSFLISNQVSNQTKCSHFSDSFLLKSLVVIVKLLQKVQESHCVEETSNYIFSILYPWTTVTFPMQNHHFSYGTAFSTALSWFPCDNGTMKNIHILKEAAQLAFVLEFLEQRKDSDLHLYDDNTEAETFRLAFMETPDMTLFPITDVREMEIFWNCFDSLWHSKEKLTFPSVLDHYERMTLPVRTMFDDPILFPVSSILSVLESSFPLWQEDIPCSPSGTLAERYASLVSWYDRIDPLSDSLVAMGEKLLSEQCCLWPSPIRLPRRKILGLLFSSDCRSSDWLHSASCVQKQFRTGMKRILIA